MDEPEQPDRRLEEMAQRIDRRLGERRPPGHKAGGGAVNQNALAVGMQMGITLLAGAGLGLAAGFFLDQWLGSRPWGTIGCFFLGVAVGMYTVFRSMSGITGPRNDAVGGRQTPPGDTWDED